MSLRLLVVEDDPAVRRSVAETLADEGVTVDLAASAEEAMGRLGAPHPDVILSDVRMPGMDGIELLRLVRERLPSVDVILMTAYEDMPTVAEAMRDGAFDFLTKPLELQELRTVLERVAADRQDRAASGSGDGTGPSAGVDGMVGRHPAMIDVYKRIGQAAAGRVTVLIAGETGTGKERVARAIHHHSADAGEPFIAVNCTALPEPLLESELFGHVKGAFTGAVADRRGRFALAGRGTILLDEIGDTTAGFQAKLLRVLEERSFYPLGAERPEPTRARVMAATHRDLAELVNEGRFRDDLYYRLKVLELRLPPLRERLTDLSLLAHRFVENACQELGRSEAALPEATLAALLNHDWPGNVRELENCLTRAVVLATGDVVRPEHLGLDSGSADQGDHELAPLRDMERAHVDRALTLTGGNKTRAAELLGISKPRLYRLLDRYEQA